MGRCSGAARRAGVIVASLVASLFAAGCAAPPTRWHEPAVAIGRWLEATAVTTDHGIAWPRVPGAAPRFDEQGKTIVEAPTADLYSGGAGPVLFFLELAAQASNREERDWARGLAERGAAELAASLPKSTKPLPITVNGAGSGNAVADDEAAGLYTGWAGVGFALAMADRWSDAAHVVDLLHQRARLAGSGIEWSDCTDVISGSAGIGDFLLRVRFGAFRDGATPADAQTAELAFDLATRAGRRLLDLSQHEPVGRSWRMDPTFPRVMPNFSHGTAGIAAFLVALENHLSWSVHADELAIEFGPPLDPSLARDAERLHAAAIAGGDHLLSIADRSDGGCRIHHHAPDGTDLFYDGWCHGPPGTARLFSALHYASLRERLGTGELDDRWQDAWRACLHTTLTSDLPTPRPGFWNNVGQCCGSAGVIEFLIDASERLHDQWDPRDAAMKRDCLALAEKLADDLVARGTRDSTGLRFLQAEHRTQPELLEAQTGFMQGAAGVGMALLHLDAIERELTPRIRLPDRE